MVVGVAAAVVMISIIGWATLTVESPVWIATAVYAALVAGGYLLFALLRRAPALISGLVFADTRSGADGPEARESRQRMLATLAAGSQMPAHSHPQEQIVHILEGKMRLIVEDVPHELSAGDSFYLASNVAHGVETLSATRVLDTFSPPRTDYLAIDEKVLHGAL